MPEYLAPGVFVEETSFRHKSIEGVGTSVAALVGPTRYGPLRGAPEVVTSLTEYTRIYGDGADLVFDGVGEPNYTAIAARAFFDNGGKQLFVSRVCRDVNRADAVNDGSGAVRAAAAASGARLRFEARFPGAAGNFTLEVRWRDAGNLLRTGRIPAAAAAALAAGESALIDTTVPVAARVNGSLLADGRFPLQASGFATLENRPNDPNDAAAGNTRVWRLRADARVLGADGVALSAAERTQLGDVLVAAALPDTAGYTRVSVRAPASGPLVANEPVVLVLAGSDAAVNLAPVLSGQNNPSNGRRRVLRGTLNAAGTVLTLTAADNRVMAADQPVAELSLSADATLALAALATLPDTGAALFALRAFDLDVLSAPDPVAPERAPEPVFAVADLSPSPQAVRHLAALLPMQPARRAERLTQPVAALYLNGEPSATQVIDSIFALADTVALLPAAGALAGPRWLIHMSGGSDGPLPGAADYTGESDELTGSTGFAALEEIEDIAIVATPAAAAHPASHAQVVQALWAHCRRMRYRVGIVDAEAGMSLNEVRAFAGQFSDSLLALYYPWVVTADPSGVRPELTVPPGGFIAGVYAGTDVRRGVHKAPANEVLIGVTGLETDVNRFRQELLNPNGINCLRFFPGRGYRVWGARTLSDDPEWRYVNVRRYFLFLERSIEKSTQWAVFEPNGEALWANVRSTVEDFLYAEWTAGHLLGASTKEAYFVRCDRSTMTQNDIDNGRLVCLIGVAPLRPAEFVIFRIGQKTADAR